MALFRRKKNQSVMPEEVRDFYASEHRDRKGMAWLLAVATLIVTFLVAAALFFGGRWVYRTVFDRDKDNGTATTQTEQGEVRSPEESARSNSSSSSSEPSTSSSSSSNSSSNTSNQPSSSSSSNSTGTSSTNTTQTPVTGPSELVNTGPGDEL